jgi:BirA family transcriptional regulator, biotin operon repressor / biotin---[acetyl-CoA-carboxylase] ligase
MDQRELEGLLADLPMGQIRYFPKVGSTNDLASRWAQAGAPDFSLVASDEQIAGRGRLNRRWVTYPGTGLAFSLVLRAENLPIETFSGEESWDKHTNLSRLTALGALAVCETLNEALPPMLPAQIKWPNDVIATRRKLAGVLVELNWSGEQLKSAILGVGVNVTPLSLPPENELDFPATCVEEVVGKPVDRWDLFHAILSNLLVWRERLPTEMFMHAWQGRLAFRGEWVRIINDAGGDGETGEEQEGQIAGINPDGSLRLRLSTGEITALQFGEIRLRQIDSPVK